MKNQSKVISPLPFPFSARSGLGSRRGCSVTGSLLIVEADNAPHLLSKYHDVGSAESSKADYKPLHHAGHGNQYRADTINTFATVPALYFPLSALGAPGPILQPDLKPTKHAR
jgi:hypothetical protein